jgi:hypothetical protein
MPMSGISMIEERLQEKRSIPMDYKESNDDHGIQY